MALSGQYERTLDEKYRLTIPKALREEFATPLPTHLYVTQGYDDCLELYSLEEFNLFAERLRERLPEVPLIVGDPSDDRLLESAGLAEAQGLLACTESDKDNLVITLTARQSKPSLRIIAQATRSEMDAKLRRAGADAVVSPSLIGGLRMASVLIRPTVVTFLDQMLRDRDKNLRVGEVSIPSDSPLLGGPLGELTALEGTRALLLALKDEGGGWVYNPTPDTTLLDGCTLILMGTPEELEKVRRELRTDLSPAGEPST